MATVTFGRSEAEARMPLAVTPVRTSRDLRQFIELPWRIHDPVAHPQWVPPLRRTVRDALDERSNPFYARAARALFVAHRDGRPVGRIAAIENRAHNAFHEDRVGFFGFFDSVDDPDVAGALLDAAGAWLLARGLTHVRGPVSPSTNHECGTLVDGFEHPPQVMTAWNPPYVDALLTGAGLAGVKDLLGYRIPLGDPGYRIPPRYAELATRVRADTRVRFRNVDMRRFDAEMAIAWEVYNAAWERNWGFVPMSRAEFEHMGRELKPVLQPQWAYVAEVDGEPAAFMLALPDLNRIFKRIGTGRLFPTGFLRLLTGIPRLRTGRVMALGVKPQFRTAGIFVLLVSEMLERAQRFGAEAPEASWVLEDNAMMNRPLQAIGATPYRRWRLYEKPLGVRTDMRAAVPA